MSEGKAKVGESEQKPKTERKRRIRISKGSKARSRESSPVRFAPREPFDNPFLNDRFQELQRSDSLGVTTGFVVEESPGVFTTFPAKLKEWGEISSAYEEAKRLGINMDKRVFGGWWYAIKTDKIGLEETKVLAEERDVLEEVKAFDRRLSSKREVVGEYKRVEKANEDILRREDSERRGLLCEALILNGYLLSMREKGFSEPLTESGSLRIRVKPKDKPQPTFLTDLEALDIFNSVVTDKYLPFILFTGNVDKREQKVREILAKEKGETVSQDKSKQKLERVHFKIYQDAPIDEAWITGRKQMKKKIKIQAEAEEKKEGKKEAKQEAPKLPAPKVPAPKKEGKRPRIVIAKIEEKIPETRKTEEPKPPTRRGRKTKVPSEDKTTVKFGVKRIANGMYFQIYGGQKIEEVNEFEKKKRERHELKTTDYEEGYYLYAGRDQVIVLDVPEVGGYEETKQKLRERVQTHFTGLDIVGVFETKVRANFIIQEVTVEFYTLVHFILLDPTFQRYFYVDESAGTYPGLKQLKVRFSLPREKRSKLRREFAFEDLKIRGRKFEVEFGISQLVADYDSPENMAVGTPYLRIESTSYSLDLMQKSRFYIVAMLKKYLNRKSALLVEYKTFVQGFKIPVEAKREEGVAVKSNLLVKIPILAEAGYPRGEKRRPLVIQESEREEWEEKRVTEKRPRQIFPFSLRGSKKVHLLVCPNDEFPYPGLMENKGTANPDLVEEVPYFPICYEKGKKTSPTMKAYEKEQKEARKEPKSKGKKPTTQVSKFLDRGSYGQLPEHVLKLLNRTPLQGEWKGLGVVKDESSFLHCILTALEVSAYTKLEDSDQKKYIERYRNASIPLRNVNVCLQEMYDSTPLEIRKALGDKTKFIDGLKFYRYFEELFNINIVMFDRLSETKTSAFASQGILEIPRHQLIHLHPRFDPNRKIVLLYKQRGSKTAQLKIPYYEVIVNSPPKLTKKSVIQKSFKLSEIPQVYDAYNKLSRVLVISSSPKQAPPQKLSPEGPPPGLEEPEEEVERAEQETPPVGADFESGETLNLLSFFEAKSISGQYLDANRKLRMVVYKDAVIVTPMLRPLGVKLVEKNIEFKTTPARALEIANEVGRLGGVHSVNTNGEGKVIGIWFTVTGGSGGGSDKFFIRCVPDELKGEFKRDLLTSPVFVTGPGGSSLEVYRETRKTMMFLLEYARFLYILYSNERVAEETLEEKTQGEGTRSGERGVSPLGAELRGEVKITSRPGEATAKDFIERYAIVDEGHVYTFRGVSQWLPRVTSLNEGLLALSRSVPGFFKTSGAEETPRLVLKTNSLKEKLLKFMGKLEEETRDFYRTPPHYIPGFYNDLEVFTKNSGEFVFLDKASALGWLKMKELLGVRLSVYEDTLEYVQEPYVFLNFGFQEGKAFLVQNVVGGDLSRALRCADNWRRTHINWGFNSKSLPQEKVKDLSPTIYQTRPEDPNLNVRIQGDADLLLVAFIFEGKEYHAALLPLESK